MAAGFAASALLEEARTGLLPLLRAGKLLEMVSAIAALAAAFVAGTPVEIALVGLLAAVALLDLLFFLLLVTSDAKAREPGAEAVDKGESPV